MGYGTGWLGWTEQQTLATRMPVIELAMSAKVEMLKACFGSSQQTPTAQEAPADDHKPIDGQMVFSIIRELAGPNPRNNK